MLRGAFSFAPVVVIVMGLVLICAARPGVCAIDRDTDPLVLTGGDLSILIGISPGRLVGFKYETGWIQIPVQVDERAVVDFGTIYNSDPSGYTFLTYTDTSTFTGPDPDSLFDADDQVALMACNSGPEATGAGEPAGVVGGTGLEVALIDPLGPDTAFVYLFESLGGLQPDAGADSIPYDFDLLSGDYKTTYNTSSGPNPEDTKVVTSAYRVHFSDRWIRDENSVTIGGASGIDILDRHRSLFAPGDCGRSEDTFSGGEGAFIVNRTGPVRALRGYVGANSGPTTYRIHAFYEEREEILTALRVHAIKGILDIFDYSPDATGMDFYDNLNTAGVTIDGVPDAVTLGEVEWEMVTGGQGTLVQVLTIDTDIPGFDCSSYYCDDSTPPEIQCTGDDYEYGASGFWEEDAIPNTDPAVGTYNVFEARRVITYAGPDQPLSFAQTCRDRALTPLMIDVSPFAPDTTASVDGQTGIGELVMGLTVEPNPVSGSVRIAFDLTSGVTLGADLYDVGGRHVLNLVKGLRAGGRSEIRADLSDLPGGIYFLRIDAWRGYRVTRRIVVLP